MIQTVVTNNLNTYRFIRWAGVHLGPNESALLDGAYPYCSKKHKAVKECFRELEMGVASIAFVTDVPTMTPEEYGQMEAAKAAKKAQKEKELSEGEPTVCEGLPEAVEVEETATEEQEPVEEAPEEEQEEDSAMFERASIDELMARKKAMPGIETHVIEDGETAKAAKNIGAQVEVIETEADNKTVSEELIGEVAVVGEEATDLSEETVVAAPEMSASAEKLASEEGISVAELAGIEGTGKDGTIIKADVQRYLKDK